MRLARAFAVTIGASLALAASAHATVLAEHVTGGVLDLVWVPGFGISNTLQPLTLGPSHPAYSNPSGDHTVGVATNSFAPDSGGVILSATDPMGNANYVWEGWFFTGDGNTRRGLVVRADPTNQFQSCYQFVLQAGLFQMNFRKLVNSAPTTLGSWFTTSLPGGIPAQNTWHHMKVIADGSKFRCFFDGFELTAVPIEDSELPAGWVGVYNFRFDLGFVPVYFDDLLLSSEDPVPAKGTSWGAIKASWR